MIDEKEILYCLALNNIPGIGIINARNLFNVFGNATEIFERRKELVHHLQPSGKRIIGMLDCPSAFTRAKRELEFVDKNHIDCICFNDKRYPSRLRECEDAPLALFYKGNADLNSLRVVGMVGTRNATDYGKELCTQFVSDLRRLCPDAVVVSGLAYGIDVAAHRASLEYGLPTVGVLAHGLDRIYPAVHRKTAVEMLERGGLITEFMSETSPDRQNFIRRNRIVAGMCDALIVVESAAKGGALITARLAENYHRECFAFPGRTNDLYSQGCNQLIRDNSASILLSAEDFVKAMQWDQAKNVSPQAIQRQLFVELSPEEERLVGIIRNYPEGIQVNLLVVEADVPINRASALLFELEMKGIVKVVAGGVYKLV